MLGEFCYWIVNMSITASVTGLIVMAARKIKAVPRRFSVFLWIIPFVRMWVPFGLNSRYSLMTLISQLTTKTVTIYQPADDIAFSVTNTLMLADSYFPIAYKVNILSKVFEISSLVWIISALALILALTILYSGCRSPQGECFSVSESGKSRSIRHYQAAHRFADVVCGSGTQTYSAT